MITVYKSRETDFSHNGLCVLNECISCNITEELNGRYELELEYPAENNKAEHLIKWNIIKSDGQLFRIYQRKFIDKDNKTLGVWARHITYDLMNYYIESINIEAGMSEFSRTFKFAFTGYSIFCFNRYFICF